MVKGLYCAPLTRTTCFHRHAETAVSQAVDLKTFGHVPKLHPSADLQGCHLAHQVGSNQPFFSPVQCEGQHSQIYGNLGKGTQAVRTINYTTWSDQNLTIVKIQVWFGSTIQSERCLPTGQRWFTSLALPRGDNKFPSPQVHQASVSLVLPTL